MVLGGVMVDCLTCLSRSRPISVERTCFLHTWKLVVVSLMGKWVCMVISSMIVMLGFEGDCWFLDRRGLEEYLKLWYHILQNNSCKEYYWTCILQNIVWSFIGRLQRDVFWLLCNTYLNTLSFLRWLCGPDGSGFPYKRCILVILII